MDSRLRRGVAFAIPVVAAVAMGAATWAGRGTPQEGTLLWTPLALSCACVGAVLWHRRVGGALAGLFIYIGLYLPFGLLLQDYAYHALPGAAWAAWAFQVSIAVSLVFVLILQLFPTGKPLTPRWRWLLWATIGAIAVSIVGSAFGPTAEFVANFPDVTFPLPLLSRGAADVVTAVGNLAGAVAFLASAVEIVVRFRRSTGDERLQMKGFALAAAVAATGFAIGVVTLPSGPALAFAVLAPLIPLAAGVSIAKYHLYDIDVVISKTIVYTLLAMFIGAVYVALVVGVSTVIPIGADSPLLSIAATGVVALTFQPARERVQRFANRLVYGQRSTPYEVLTRFSDRVGNTYANDDILPRTARVIAEGVNAERATIWLHLADELRPSAGWPHVDPAAASLPLEDDALPDVPGEHVAEIRYQGELLGAISIDKRRGDPLKPGELRLIDDLAAQAGLVVSNVRLTADLEARLEVITRQADELRASRQRIVAAQDEERRRLERNIHDGAQQHLVALAVKLRLARGLLARDPEKARTMLREIAGQIDEALETLHALALGIYPPRLEADGVVAALGARYGSSDLPVRFHVDGVGRYPLDAEAAVYFCVLEALQNAAKYAEAASIDVTFAERDGALTFEVVDDGAGFDPAIRGNGTGVHGMQDRLAVLGGDVALTSAPGRGTTVRGHVPLAAEVPS